MRSASWSRMIAPLYGISFVVSEITLPQSHPSLDISSLLSLTVSHSVDTERLIMRAVGVSIQNQLNNLETKKTTADTPNTNKTPKAIRFGEKPTCSVLHPYLVANTFSPAHSDLRSSFLRPFAVIPISALRRNSLRCASAPGRQLHHTQADDERHPDSGSLQALV